MAAFLARNGRRGFADVFVLVDDVAGFGSCALFSRGLTFEDSFGGRFLEGSVGRGKSAEMEVSGPAELLGGGKDDGRVCG